jgi:hypothetical protein
LLSAGCLTLFRMSDKMDKLLAVIAEFGDEEDVLIQFRDASWSGTSLQLRLAVSELDSEVDSLPGIWDVRCENVLGYALSNGSANWLELTEDHPLLWDFKHQSASAFFYKAPPNADAVVGALYEAHQRAVGSWINFGKHLNGTPGLSSLLAAGNGLLASGPLPLLNLYKEILRSHGVEIDIRFPHPPKIWDGRHWRELEAENDTKALITGTSYVIGSGWTAQQKS